MLTNREIDEIIAEVDAGEYDIEDALSDIATAARGEDVRKALFAEAYALNKEGHAGSSDMGARAQITVLKRSVDGLKEDKADKSEVGAVDSRIDTIINQIQVGTNEVTLFEGSAKGIGAVITLSDNLSNYDYLDVYVDKHGVTDILTIPATFTGGINFRFMNIADTQPDTGLDIDELSLQQTSETTLLINNESNWHWSGAANAAAVHTLVSVESTDSVIAKIIKIVGKKINSDFRNAELLDIRNGFDSETYETAGAAVRGQVSGLNDKIGNLGNLITENKSDLVSAINEAAASGGSGSGLSETVKAAILQIAAKVAYTDENGQSYYNSLYDALYPPANLVSISATYTQSGTVTPSTDLDDLRNDLVVTALWDNSNRTPVTTYTLSGTLAVGTSTVTVSFGGETTTFNVTVTEASGDPICTLPVSMRATSNAGSWNAETHTGTITVNGTASWPGLVLQGLLFKYQDVSDKTLRITATITTSGVVPANSGRGVIIVPALYTSQNPANNGSARKASVVNDIDINEDGTFDFSQEWDLETEFVETGIDNYYLGLCIFFNKATTHPATATFTISNIIAEVF